VALWLVHGQVHEFVVDVARTAYGFRKKVVQKFKLKGSIGGRSGLTGKREKVSNGRDWQCL
jgi:hypothetical protein